MWHHSVVREPVCSSIPFVTNELKRTTVSKRSIASPSEPPFWYAPTASALSSKSPLCRSPMRESALH